jgi:malto-oligosyltrehalose trehalohydrolase
LDDGPLRPDPRSHFQPLGVHGPSQIIDQTDFQWSDDRWSGIDRSELVIYEAHVGCGSPIGTYRGLQARLPQLRELGVNALELMPLAETPGRWNWGYDGVHLFAPKAAYGTPHELKALIDECHRQGFAVLLDVVYNHLGPEGNYLREFGPYFSPTTKTPWGEALNYSGRHRHPVRRWILDNVVHWIGNYHFDGLRVDAIHYLFDSQSPSMTEAIAHEFDRLRTLTRRQLHLIAETNVYDPVLCQEQQPSAPPLPSAASQPAHYSAQWADCLLHAVYSLGAPAVKLTHRDYLGSRDVLTALRQGYVYQGSRAGDYQRVEPTDAPPRVHPHLVVALQTHDSVGNHPHGRRLHALADYHFQMAAAGLTLLAPSIPQIFMGEEGAVDRPFRFFADFGDPQLRAAVDRGRQREYPHHHWVGAVPPSDPEAFFGSRLPDFAEWNLAVWHWYRLLLWIRRQGLAQGWLGASQAHWTADLDQGHFVLEYGSSPCHCRVDSWLLPRSPNDTRFPTKADPGVAAGETTAVGSVGLPVLKITASGAVLQSWDQDSTAVHRSRCRVQLTSAASADLQAFPRPRV